MIRFGEIKNKIETILIESYKKDSFKKNFSLFKKYILGNKRLSETYYLYDELHKNKGFNKEKSEEYLNECVTVIKENLTKETKNLYVINEWLSNVKNDNNPYKNLDIQVYDSGVKNIEKLVESKLQLMESLCKTESIKKDETIKLPISSSLKIANKILKNSMSNLSESEINQIKKLSSLSTKELGVEIEKNKKEVLVKLNENLNSTNDEELINKINETINKINNSKNSYLTLYTIKDLNKKI